MARARSSLPVLSAVSRIVAWERMARAASAESARRLQRTKESLREMRVHLDILLTLAV
jgi:hypothetical protein